MTLEDIQKRAEIVVEELSKNFGKLAGTFADAAEGKQSIEYLDAVYSVLREDVKEISSLYEEYTKLKGETE